MSNALAQNSTQQCRNYFESDRWSRSWYPEAPIPDGIATSFAARQMAELKALTTTTKASDAMIKASLDRWLIGWPDAPPPEAPYSPYLDDLIRELPPHRIPELVEILDQVTARVERLPNPQDRRSLIPALANYYHRLNVRDRANPLFPRLLQSSLQIADQGTRASQVFYVLNSAIAQGKTQEIQALLPQVEATIAAVSSFQAEDERIWYQVTMTLSVARAYLEINQPEKAVALVDRAAQANPRTWPRPEIPELYVRLNRLSKAQPHIKAILESTTTNDRLENYANLISALDQANQSQSATQLFNLIWNRMKDIAGEFQTPFVQPYLRNGNLDRLFQALQRSNDIGVQISHLLRVAGAYSQRQQPQQAKRAIATFVQVVANNKTIDASSQILDTVAAGYLNEAQMAFDQLVARDRIDPKGYRLIDSAAAIDRLDVAERLVQRLQKSDPEQYNNLMSQIAIAYAKKSQAAKAIATAERMPPQRPNAPSAVETLVQVGVILYQTPPVGRERSALEKAKKLVETLPSLEAKATAYGAIARAYTQIAQPEMAEKTRQLAVKSAQQIAPNPDTGMSSVWMLSMLSQQFLQANQVEAGWKTFQAIPVNAYKDINIDSLVTYALPLGRFDIAIVAADLVHRHHSAQSYVFIAPRLARELLGHDRIPEALAILDRAAKLLHQQKERSPDQLAEVVKLYAQQGRINDAQRLLTKYPYPGQASYEQRKQELQQYIDCYASKK